MSEEETTKIVVELKLIRKTIMVLIGFTCFFLAGILVVLIKA
jgi:hypothetical protein